MGKGKSIEYPEGILVEDRSQEKVAEQRSNIGKCYREVPEVDPEIERMNGVIRNFDLLPREVQKIIKEGGYKSVLDEPLAGQCKRGLNAGKHAKRNPNQKILTFKGSKY